MMTRIFTLLLFLTVFINVSKAQSVIYNEDFEGAGFSFEKFFLTTLDNGIPADTNRWGIFADTAWILTDAENNGNHVALATSFYSPEVDANDWLITPAIKLGPASTLKWKAKSLFGSNAEKYSVYISTSNQSVSGCEFNGSIVTIDGECDTEYAEHMVDLAELGYINQKIYVGFNLNTTNGVGFLVLDNIEVSDDSLVGPVTLSFTVNMTDQDTILSADTGFVDIVGNFNDWDGRDYKLIMSETDSNIYSINIPGFYLGEELEFKFRINGSWHKDTIEFSKGELNRVWKIEKDRYIYIAKYNKAGTIYGIENQPDILSNINIFPNPVSNNLYLNGTEDILSIKLIDIRGVVVFSRNFRSEDQIALDLSDLKSGLYFAMLTDKNNNSGVRKIIKQ